MGQSSRPSTQLCCHAETRTWHCQAERFFFSPRESRNSDFNVRLWFVKTQPIPFFFFFFFKKTEWLDEMPDKSGTGAACWRPAGDLRSSVTLRFGRTVRDRENLRDFFLQSIFPSGTVRSQGTVRVLGNPVSPLSAPPRPQPPVGGQRDKAEAERGAQVGPHKRQRERARSSEREASFSSIYFKRTKNQPSIPYKKHGG